MLRSESGISLLAGCFTWMRKSLPFPTSYRTPHTQPPRKDTSTGRAGRSRSAKRLDTLGLQKAAQSRSAKGWGGCFFPRHKPSGGAWAAWFFVPSGNINMRCLLIGASQDLMKVNLLKVERERPCRFLELRSICRGASFSARLLISPRISKALLIDSDEHITLESGKNDGHMGRWKTALRLYRGCPLPCQ